MTLGRAAMGTGLGPAWFSPEFPSLAARREPFPDVDRWQATYVRYSGSETTQARGWDVESCRRNLSSTGVNDHPIMRQKHLPESISMRIIEAPAEFALPVKQDRRLLPCFKVRLEVQHRGAVSLPVTLRAHVLSQQEKDQIGSWLPPDDANERGNKGQKAATELKGTSIIRCTLEAGSTGEIRTISLGGKDGQGFPQNCSSGPSIMAHCNLLRGAERLVKPEPLHHFTGAANGTGVTVMTAVGPAAGLSGGSGRGPMPGLQQPDQHTLQSYGIMESSGLMRDMGPTGLNGGHAREVGLSNLFAANRPDPVVTLASSGRMSGTGSSFPGLGLRLSPEDPRDNFDAAVEMLMQQPLQPPSLQQRRSSPLQVPLEANVIAGGSQLLNDMQRQLLQRQEEQGQRMQPGPDISGLNSAVLQGNKLITATQDFEFTNLEFLKPTRMNKVYMAFTVSFLDNDLLFVVFNIPTIGICRAEQREKACKKLHIDYRLLSHFDQGVTERLDSTATSGGTVSGSGVFASHASLGPSLESNSPQTQERYGAPPRPEQGRSALQLQQQQQFQHAAQQPPPPPAPPPQQQQPQQQQQPGLQDPKYAQPLSPSPSMLSGSANNGIRLNQRPESGRLPGHLSDMDFPRMSPAFDIHHPQPHPQQQRLTEGCGGGAAGLQTGGLGNGSGGLLGSGGCMPVTVLSPHALATGSMATNAGMNMNGLGAGGMVGAGGNMACGGGLGSRMMPNEMAFGMGSNVIRCDLGAPGGQDFYFGSGGGLGGGLNCSLNGNLAVGSGGTTGMSLNGVMAMGGSAAGLGHLDVELGVLGVGGNSRKRDQGLKGDDNYRFQPVQPQELPPYQGFMGLTSSDVEMLLPAPHSRMAMRDFINEVYDGTGLHRKLTHMDMQALLSQAGFPMDSNREHDTISPQQWDEFCSQFRSIVNTLQQVASVWNMEDPVVISGFDMDRAGTIAALANEPAGTFICRFSMSQPGCLVLTCKVGIAHPRADPMGLIHAIIKIDDLHERRVDTWIRDYAGATHLLDVYRQKRVDKRKVFATNYTRLRGLEVGGEQLPLGLGPVCM